MGDKWDYSGLTPGEPVDFKDCTYILNPDVSRKALLKEYKRLVREAVLEDFAALAGKKKA